MLRTIGWYAYFAISLLFVTPKLLKVKKLHKQGLHKEADQCAHEVTSKWALWQVNNSGAKVELYGVENLPKDQNVVFISNHQGNFDIALFMSYIDVPKGFISKIEIKKLPLIRTWMTYIHCVFMDRSSMRSAACSIVDGIKIIQQGHSLVIFPEGTRSKGGPLSEFKAGSFKLATKPKVPIIPVTIDGSYKLMESQGGKVKPATVKMYIHPPISTAQLSKEELTNLPERVKTIIASKLPC